MLRYDSFLKHGGGAAPGGDPYWANVIFLASWDGADAATAFTDESTDARAITFVADAQLDTAQKTLGYGASLLLDGTGDYVSLADDDPLSVDTGDFTFEGFFRPHEGGRQQALMNKRDSSSAEEFSLNLNTDRTLTFLLFRAGAATLTLNGTTALTLDTWYHIAVGRTGATSYLFAGGNLEASGDQANTPTVNTAPFKFGYDGYNSARAFNGWIQETRLTKGANRYTAGFTAPSSPFPRS